MYFTKDCTKVIIITRIQFDKRDKLREMPEDCSKDTGSTYFLTRVTQKQRRLFQ